MIDFERHETEIYLIFKLVFKTNQLRQWSKMYSVNSQKSEQLLRIKGLMVRQRVKDIKQSDLTFLSGLKISSVWSSCRCENTGKGVRKKSCAYKI